MLEQGIVNCEHKMVPAALVITAKGCDDRNAIEVLFANTRENGEFHLCGVLVTFGDHAERNREMPQWIPIDLRTYYLSTYVRPGLASLPFAAACWYIAQVVVPGGYLSFFAWMTAAMPLYLVPIWFIALTAGERAAARDYIRQRVGGRRVAEVAP